LHDDEEVDNGAGQGAVEEGWRMWSDLRAGCQEGLRRGDLRRRLKRDGEG
jgi:hypothetical protein